MIVPKILKIKTNFKGLVLPRATSGCSGHAFEKILEKNGNPVNVVQCADYPEFELEVKTKENNSRSANVVGTMSIDDIINKSYEDSSIAQKFQKQFRVKTTDAVIVSQEVFNFSKPYIQDIIKEPYEIGRNKIINGNRDNYIPCTRFGYFERRKNTNSYMFRISVGAMNALEISSKSKFDELFVII